MWGFGGGDWVCLSRFSFMGEGLPLPHPVPTPAPRLPRHKDMKNNLGSQYHLIPSIMPLVTVKAYQKRGFVWV